MPQDIIDQVEPYRTNESSRWNKLASTVQWRRLVILLLREIVVELRALRSQTSKLEPRHRPDPTH